MKKLLSWAGAIALASFAMPALSQSATGAAGTGGYAPLQAPCSVQVDLSCAAVDEAHPLPVTVVSGGGGGGDASAANQVALNTIIGAVTASPAANTVLDRLKALNTTLNTPFQAGGALGASSNEIGRVNQTTFNVNGSTLTRPANVTAYSANDSISDNATAGSVTALSVTVADVNDAPVAINEIKVASTDTGPGTAGARIRVWIYNVDPTASSGVGGGDNAAFSNKRAGFVSTFIGTFQLFADGSEAVCIPEGPVGTAGGGLRLALPTSGARTLYFQFQTLDAFTPSANSTTFIPRFKGWQVR